MQSTALLLRAALAAACLACALPATASAAPKPPSLEDFAMRPYVQDADLSPGGKHLAVLRLLGRGKHYAVFVYETAHLDRDPYTLGSKHMDIQAVSWANDERLLIWARQPVEVPGNRIGYNTVGTGGAGKAKTYAHKLLSVGLDGSRWIELPRKSEIKRFATEIIQNRLARPNLVSRLPEEKDWVLVGWSGDGGSSADLFKVNVKNGRARSVFRQSQNYSGYGVDSDREVRLRSAYLEDDTIQQQYRLKGSEEWKVLFSWKVADRVPIDILGFADAEGGETFNHVYVRTAKDRDTEAIYRYDLQNPGNSGELLFAHKRFDASGVLIRDMGDQEEGVLTGFSYVADEPRFHYIDEEEAALKKSINAVLPAGNLNVILDRAADDKYIVIRSRGPREPGRFYLLTDRSKITEIGRVAFIEPEQLGPMRALWFKARDGMKIHAVLTLPPTGKPPYPSIALPHGGPWARDAVSWDEWAQLLATRGYAVLQPNFRGSTGFGQKYWRAGDAKWGYEMQDDVDDGMLHLVKQGIADPKRMAIFGWSYGGYSAMVGSLREPNLYRCAIPGAGVSSMELIELERSRNRFIDIFQAPATGGLSPIKEAKNVNVPVLLIHGDRDQIVPIKHSDMFARALKSHGKPHKYVKLVDAAHTVDTIGYEHSMKFYAALLDFLAGDCGMK